MSGFSDPEEIRDALFASGESDVAEEVRRSAGSTMSDDVVLTHAFLMVNS